MGLIKNKHVRTFSIGVSLFFCNYVAVAGISGEGIVEEHSNLQPSTYAQDIQKETEHELAAYNCKKRKGYTYNKSTSTCNRVKVSQQQALETRTLTNEKVDKLVDRDARFGGYRTKESGNIGEFYDFKKMKDGTIKTSKDGATGTCAKLFEALRDKTKRLEMGQLNREYFETKCNGLK